MSKDSEDYLKGYSKAWKYQQRTILKIRAEQRRKDILFEKCQEESDKLVEQIKVLRKQKRNLEDAFNAHVRSTKEFTTK